VGIGFNFRGRKGNQRYFTYPEDEHAPGIVVEDVVAITDNLFTNLKQISQKSEGSFS
jgi:hypothetical protein